MINNIVVEARAAHSTGDKKAIKEGRSVNEGKLLGQVILATELDRRLVSRHDIKSFYESVVIHRNIPIVKLSKEFVPKAYDNGFGDFNSSPTDREGFRGRKVQSVFQVKEDPADRYGQGPDPGGEKDQHATPTPRQPNNVRHLHHYNHL